MERLNKQLVVKDWFANKIASEEKRHGNYSRVFAIMKETEKAYYCWLNIGAMDYICRWVPKAAIIEQNANDEEDKAIKETDTTKIYSAFRAMWSAYM